MKRKMAEFKINYKDIKSSYIIKGIFSFLYAKHKLNIIMYNKELQNACNINMEDYKNTSGKYKISEKNGKGREYILNTDILIFEGEYLNRKRSRSGKGKDFYKNGKLKFEGEYINGKKRNGIGYNINGNMEFEIKDGKGKIKEYDECGKLIFEGDYLKGERNGKGKEYYNNGKLLFEGKYLNGRKIGKGKEYYNNGNLLFVGEYLNERKWSGNGYNIKGDMEFKIINGKGYIKKYDENGKLTFEGEYINGERNGKGKEYYKNGQILFEGEYLNGRKWDGNGYNINGNIEF